MELLTMTNKENEIMEELRAENHRLREALRLAHEALSRRGVAAMTPEKIIAKARERWTDPVYTRSIGPDGEQQYGYRESCPPAVVESLLDSLYCNLLDNCESRGDETCPMCQALAAIEEALK
jgi:hypothetical protein